VSATTPILRGGALLSPIFFETPYLHQYGSTYCDRMRHDNTWGRCSMILEESHMTRIPRAEVHRPIPQKWDKLHTQYDNSNRILHSDQHKWKGNFSASITHLALDKTFVTGMLTRYLFVVANLLDNYTAR